MVNSSIYSFPISILQDVNLSWSAKGLLCYLINQPSDFRINTDQLSLVYQGNKKGSGKDAISRIIQELIENRYLEYTKSKDDHGKWVHNYQIINLNN